MFSWHDFLAPGLLILIFLGRVVYKHVYLHYAYQLLSSMPWMKWMTFEEIIAASKCPRFFAQRILMQCVVQGHLEHDLNEAINDERFTDHFLTVMKEETYGIAEVFKYRRNKRLRPRKKRKLLLPKNGPVGEPALI